MTNVNEEALRRGYEALAEGEPNAMAALLADDAVLHAAGHGPLSGEFGGRDRLLGMYSEMQRAAGGTYRIRPHAILADDEHAVALEHHSCEIKGETFSANNVMVYHMQAGTITEMWLYPEDQEGSDDFQRMLSARTS